MLGKCLWNDLVVKTVTCTVTKVSFGANFYPLVALTILFISLAFPDIYSLHLRYI